MYQVGERVKFYICGDKDGPYSEAIIERVVNYSNICYCIKAIPDTFYLPEHWRNSSGNEYTISFLKSCGDTFYGSLDPTHLEKISKIIKIT